jgi:hypothetical protein
VKAVTAADVRAGEQLAMARCGGFCEICGNWLTGNRGTDWSLHHRLPRRMGGTRRPEVYRAANLLAIHGSGTTGCHGAVESGRSQALDNGLILHDGAVPADVSVLLRYGLVLLADDGTWREAS